MPTIRDEAVCLRRWEFSETSQTVCLLTRDHGVIRGLAKGAHRDRGRFSGGFDVLTRGEIVAIVRPGRDLATLTDWHLRDIARALRTDLLANRRGLYAADLLHHMLTDQDPHPTLFDRLVRTLADLDHPDRIDGALLRLQWAIVTECGYRPILDHDVRTGAALSDRETAVRFDPDAGGLTSTREGRGWLVRRSTTELLKRLDQLRDDAPLIDDPTGIDRANRLLAAYLREILGTELTSVRWCFGTLAGC